MFFYYDMRAVNNEVDNSSFYCDMATQRTKAHVIGIYQVLILISFSAISFLNLGLPFIASLANKIQIVDFLQMQILNCLILALYLSICVPPRCLMCQAHWSLLNEYKIGTSRFWMVYVYYQMHQCGRDFLPNKNMMVELDFIWNDFKLWWLCFPQI